MTLSSLLVEPASTKENNCLNAAKACNLNDTCKKYRSAYINPCTSRVSTSEVCNKRKCHKALRQFFDKVIILVFPTHFLFRKSLLLQTQISRLLCRFFSVHIWHRRFILKINSFKILLITFWLLAAVMLPDYSSWYCSSYTSNTTFYWGWMLKQQQRS